MYTIYFYSFEVISFTLQFLFSTLIASLDLIGLTIPLQKKKSKGWKLTTEQQVTDKLASTFGSGELISE